MIVEDYCSFEIAKLLKEKGFDAEIKTYWSLGLLNEPILEFVKDPYEFDVSNSNCFVGFNGTKYSSTDIVCIAPTLQMAMKWLREEHGLFIFIGNDDLNYSWQVLDIKNRRKDLDPSCITNSYAGYRKYEQACEDALKYSITNLI